MLITKKMLIGLALVVALVGAGVGSLATHTAQNTEAANNSSYQPATTGTTASATTANNTAYTPEQVEATKSAQYSTSAEQTAYRDGFDEGFNSCQSARTNNRSQTLTAYSAAPTRRYYSSSRSRRVYYDYSNRPRGRTFWQKHRDKLTMAMGTGGGALIGGLIGGKKGAGIGSLVGLGGSALYTYKLRHRTRRY